MSDKKINIEMKTAEARFMRNKLLLKREALAHELEKTDGLIGPLTEALKDVPQTPEEEEDGYFNMWFYSASKESGSNQSELLRKAFKAGYLARQASAQPDSHAGQG